MHQGKVQPLALEPSSVTQMRHISPREPKAEPSGKLAGKRSSQRRAELSDKSETKRSKFPERMKEKLNFPCRCSKRLAGQQPEPVNNLVSTLRTRQSAARKNGRQGAGLSSDDLENRASQQLGVALETKVADHTLTEVNYSLLGVPLSKVKRPLENLVVRHVDSLGSNGQTLQVATGESSRGDTSRDTGMVSNNFVNGASLQFGASSESEDFFDTLDDIDFSSHVELLSRGIMLLDDQLLSKEQPHKFEIEEMDPDLLSFLFREEPCFEVAVKIITGELPFEALMNGSCCRSTTAKSYISKAIQAVDLANGTSQKFEAIQEKKVANDPCTIINSSLHEENIEQDEKSLENQAAAKEKPQMLETEQAAVEHPLSVLSFLLPDTCFLTDPFFEYAFQTAREDNVFQAYFQKHLYTTDNQIDRLPRPDIGSPTIFQSDVTPQFNTAGAYVPYFPVHLFPMNPSLPPSGNVSQPLSMNCSSQHAGNECFSNGSEVGPDQLISMNPSSFPAGNVALSSSNGVGTRKPCLGDKQED